MTQAERDIVYWLTQIRDGVGSSTDNWQAIVNILNRRGDVI